VRSHSVGITNVTYMATPPRGVVFFLFALGRVLLQGSRPLPCSAIARISLCVCG